MRAPEIPGNMAALMTVSQVTIRNSSKKVLNTISGYFERTVSILVHVRYFISVVSVGLWNGLSRF